MPQGEPDPDNDIELHWGIHDDGLLRWLVLEGGSHDAAPTMARLIGPAGTVVAISDRARPLHLDDGPVGLGGVLPRGVALLTMRLAAELVAGLLRSHFGAHRFEAQVDDEWRVVRLTDTRSRTSETTDKRGRDLPLRVAGGPHPIRRHRRMSGMDRIIAAAAASILLATACAGSQAATPASAAFSASPAASGVTRVEGIVKSNDSGRVTLADGTGFDLTRTTRVVRSQAGTPADLKPGLFVAITAKEQPDQTLLASIVSVFPESLSKVVPPGQRPLSGGNLMTNAAIDQVSGNSFTVTFPGGAATINLAPGAQIIRQSDVQALDITVGSKISASILNGAAQSVTIQP